MSTSKTNAWLLSGLIAGALAGGITAIVVANRKNKQMLDETYEISGKFMNKARERGEKQIKEAREAADKLISGADEILKLSKKYAGGEYEEQKEEFKKELENIRKKINEI